MWFPLLTPGVALDKRRGRKLLREEENLAILLATFRLTIFSERIAWEVVETRSRNRLRVLRGWVVQFTSVFPLFFLRSSARGRSDRDTAFFVDRTVILGNVSVTGSALVKEERLLEEEVLRVLFLVNGTIGSGFASTLD